MVCIVREVPCISDPTYELGIRQVRRTGLPLEETSLRGSEFIIATMNELASQPGLVTPDDMEFLLSNNRPVGDAPAANEPQDEVLEQNFGRREKAVVPQADVETSLDQLADIDPGISSDSRGVLPSSLQPNEGPDDVHEGVGSANDFNGPTAPTVTEVSTPTFEEDLLHLADVQQLTENDESDIVHMDPLKLLSLEWVVTIYVRGDSMVTRMEIGVNAIMIGARRVE